MPSIYCQRIFVPGSYYHIYNRGAHQELLFRNSTDYQAFTEILEYYILHPLGTPPSVVTRYSTAGYHRAIHKDPFFAQLSSSTQKDIHAYNLICYCLMPNHFHLMVRQIDGNVTISNLMRRLCVGYAMYYNDKHHHSGTIFQGKYKNILVENEYQWLYLSKYIHRNPLHGKVGGDGQRTDLCTSLADYPYSSFPHYIGRRTEKWISSSEMLGRYKNNAFQKYRDFVLDGSDSGNIAKQAIDHEELQY